MYLLSLVEYKNRNEMIKKSKKNLKVEYEND